MDLSDVSVGEIVRIVQEQVDAGAEPLFELYTFTGRGGLPEFRGRALLVSFIAKNDRPVRMFVEVGPPQKELN